ncbi:MAG: DUF4365 domain-containing protein [Sphaerospermopsis sp. SIO1G2]|nr:DUF4365 domain-containing protein [Sphaerospermopsis sp. SIO1G2]
MSNTSEHTWYQQREILSFNYLQSIITKKGCKIRKLEQDNDIDAEIEIFDTLQDKNQTLAQFIKIQLKAEDECEIKSDHIIYDKCPVKFLHFCDVCDIPVVLVLYEANTEKAYWLWMQDYIYNDLDINNYTWRNNQNTVTLKIPIHNLVNNDEIFFKDITLIGDKGINEISQMRKSKTYQNYYTVMKQSDKSHGTLRRIAVEILIEKSFAYSQDAMKLIIPKINRDFINSDYYRSDITKEIFANKHSDIIWLFFYDDPLQLDHGLPFCRTEWIKNRNKINPVIFTNNEYEKLIDSIQIQWLENFNISSDFIRNKQLTKGKYFDIAQELYQKFCGLYDKIQTIYISYQNCYISLDEMRNKIRSISETTKQLIQLISDSYLYTHKVDNLYQILLNLVVL